MSGDMVVFPPPPRRMKTPLGMRGSIPELTGSTNTGGCKRLRAEGSERSILALDYQTPLRSLLYFAVAETSTEAGLDPATFTALITK